MDHLPTPSRRLVSDRLHRNVYLAMMAFAAWLVASIWGFFSDRGYTGLALAVVSAFVFVVVVLQYMLSRLASRRPDSPESADGSAPWRDWISGEFETRQGRLRAAQATIEILLPIAAVALGMTAFAVIYHLGIGTAA